MITPFCHRFAAALLFAAALPAFAASFDCAKAQTDVEKAVCADKQLSALDDQLASTYRYAIAALGKLDITSDQREWANNRTACDKAKFNECLSQSYTDRIDILTKLGNAARDPARRVKLDFKDDPYNVDAVMIEECCQGLAWVFIESKRDHKSLQALPLVQLYPDTSIGAVKIEDYNQDGIKDIALRTGSGFNGWDYYLSTKNGKFEFNPALTELQYDANTGIELEPNGEIRIVHVESPSNYYVADYKMVGDKPVLTKKETYLDDKLVDSSPRQHGKKRKHSAAGSD